MFYGRQRNGKPSIKTCEAVEKQREAVEKQREAIEKHRRAVEKQRDAVEKRRGAVEIRGNATNKRREAIVMIPLKFNHSIKKAPHLLWSALLILLMQLLD
ncbi:hypothetical protein FPQ13_03175 [Allobacillus salarius]|uniref:Uncharacterized protein n=1 Tax=Allobacillus salarius TaxID=1955272 RepID=A0A556PR34_9BACI|nr:hypothetical protein FPQ13_03175 [Allobacillus salarius]